jgi:hypothetical protein
MAGYDATKRFGKRLGLADGPALQGCAAVAAALCASTLSAPADVLQTAVMSSQPREGGGGMSLRAAAHSVWRTAGVHGFFCGWSVNVTRLVPTFLVGSTIYEQTRAVLGLKYMT